MELELFESSGQIKNYATVILPIAVPKAYTYEIPNELMEDIQFGVRAEVQFGRNKLYAALVVDIHQQKPEEYRPKKIHSILDEAPIITTQQVDFWRWIAQFYMCTVGEVMNAALPSGLKLSSETKISISPFFEGDFSGLSDREYLVAEALTIQEELTIQDLQGILGQKTVYPVIKGLIEKHIIYLKEELQSKYKPKTIACVRLQEPYVSQPEKLKEAFDLTARSGKQTEALMAYLHLAKAKKTIRKQEIYDTANVSAAVVKGVVDKGIFEIYKQEISRIGTYEDDTDLAKGLSEQQARALGEIEAQFEEKNVVLLHGVTGSGKTEIYIDLIQKAKDRGEQVLYLLPEIALTAQIIQRLQRVFGEEVLVYHSKLNNHERVEIWKEILAGKPIILGARSGLFMPFQHLGLIIIDEEHDPSFKQREPNPRYHARDAAIYLAYKSGAKVLLGTATPAIETYQNATNGKYGLVEMKERFGGLKMPAIVIADVKAELKKRAMQSHFTLTLIDEIKATLERKEQVILFQNRRGFAPSLRCTTCDWVSECINCDVSLTYHKYHDNLICHYCGYHTKQPVHCSACGSDTLTLKGFGTEKVEDELKIYLPEARIGRMDMDTVRTKNAYSKIINDFEEKRLDILVGTQMVTKGLDFSNVSLVGVLSADQLVNFPDFRASERAFQLMTQVSGRAGRRKKQGKVIIQAMNKAHPVIKEVLENDYDHFFKREIKERHEFAYPPFARLIKITLKHVKPATLREATKLFDHYLKKKLGDKVKGPAQPGVPRVRNYYLIDFLIKMGKSQQELQVVQSAIQLAKTELNASKGLSSVRVVVDVDPY